MMLSKSIPGSSSLMLLLLGSSGSFLVANGAPVEFPIYASKRSCASVGAVATPGQPVLLSDISTANGNRTLLLEPLSDVSNGTGKMCVLSRWTVSLAEKNRNLGSYYPLGRSIVSANGGDWSRPPGKAAGELSYNCGTASNAGNDFAVGDYLCEVTLPITQKPLADGTYDKVFAPYYMTYYERSVTVRNEISRFLQKTTFGPTPQEIDALETAYLGMKSNFRASHEEIMSKLQTEWISAQMNPATFSTGAFTSLRAYYRKRLNARTSEIYRIGESGPAPCEINSRWRKFVFTNFDLQNSKYLRWGDDGVTTQSKKPLNITVETVVISGPSSSPTVEYPSLSPSRSMFPSRDPVGIPSSSPSAMRSEAPSTSMAPTRTDMLGFGDFENTDVSELSIAQIKAAWPGTCPVNVLTIPQNVTDLASHPNYPSIYSGRGSLNVTSGSNCFVMRMIGANCPAERMSYELQAGDTVKISLWIKTSQADTVFQIYTAHYHALKVSRWAKPEDDSYVVTRVSIPNANEWTRIQAIHTVGSDWTFGNQTLVPKLCNHYQLRFNVANPTVSYLLDNVRMEKVSSISEGDKKVGFIRNPKFVLQHQEWVLSSTSGTLMHDSDLDEDVMVLKRGQALRQSITSSAVPAEKYLLGFWARGVHSSKPITIKIIIRMKFTNNDRMYGPCKNPVCNLYIRPLEYTISANDEAWHHVILDDFEMFGNYSAWNGTVNEIFFELVTNSGMANTASLRLANFHDLRETSAPPSLSLVPSVSPSSLMIDEVGYVVRFAGDIRTVLRHPFQIDETGEVLPMDGSVSYVLCEVEEVHGSEKGFGLLVDDVCKRIRGGNPKVDLDPRFVNITELNILDLSRSSNSSIIAINVGQTNGDDLLLTSTVQDEACAAFPSPYDNDYRGATEASPDRVPSRFNPDKNVFAKLPDNSYALYDPRLILRENTLENPLIDGGGSSVLRSVIPGKNRLKAMKRADGKNYFVQNDENIVLCSNEHPNFLNREHCVLSYEPNACVVERPTYVNEMQRHTFINAQLTITFDNETLAALHNASLAKNVTSSAGGTTTAGYQGRFIYAVSNLRYDTSNSNGSLVVLPCMRNNPKSRWIPRPDLDGSECTNALQQSSVDVLASAIESSNDQNSFLRDIILWNNDAGDGCATADLLSHGMLIMTQNEGCWENVHPNHMDIYDFTNYVSEHPTSNSADTSITGFSQSGILHYPDMHPMSYFESLRVKPLTLPYISRYGDIMIVDDFAEITGFNVEPNTLMSIAELGSFKVNNAIDKNRGGGVLVCGSPNEVVPDPTLDDVFDVLHADLDCVGCQKSYGDYFTQKQTVWTINALEAEDQFCYRMSWALYELINVGTTTAPDNTESNLYTYDIFLRHCFGNYYDILKEMSFNPKMGEQFGYVMSTSTRWRYDGDGTMVYPDENYAREVMQLYTIGLHKLNEDGTEVKDQFGRVVQTYTNRDILSNARIWTGLEYTARRGNVEELFRASKSRQDPMRVEIDKHDFFPKFTLDGWIGDRYPLCTDRPQYHFLKFGAEYRLRGGTSLPSSHSMPEAWDADENIKRFVLSPTSNLFQKLCNPSPDGSCQYSNTVILTENLPCTGKECFVDTLVTLQVSPGVFYEYIPKPCVNYAFYNDAKKVVTGFSSSPRLGKQYTHTMCAHPKTTAAARSCCSTNGSNTALYNYKFGFHGERVTAVTNNGFCAANGMVVCDPKNITADFPLVTLRSKYNQVYPSQNTFFWTNANCSQYIKVRPDGMVAIIHEAVKNPLVKNEKTIPFVSLSSSVTYITIPWPKDYLTGKYLYPNLNNTCDRGACTTLADNSCLCPVIVTESTVHTVIPTRDDVLSTLKVGAFNPIVYSDSVDSYQVINSTSDVKVYSRGAVLDPSTIFEIKDEMGATVYLKNSLINVTVGSSYIIRNPVSFINLVKIDELDAEYEIEAFLMHLMRHPSSAPFVSRKLIQYFGISNPSPPFVQRVTQTFKQGSFSKNQLTFGDGRYGNLAAVAAAITLDPEAVNIVVDEDPINGNVREPLLKVIHILRSLSFTRRPGVKLQTGLLKELSWKIGQMVFEPPDQFSFFSTDYSPPGVFAAAEMVSPESQLLTMSSVIGITNGFFSLFNFGLSNADGGFGPFISTERNISDYNSSVGFLLYEVNQVDVASKINALDTIITGGRLSPDNKLVLLNAYTFFIKAYDPQTADRVLMGLLSATPEFHTSNFLRKTGSKRAVTPPATKSSTPYKAIIYLHLSGGLDSYNLLTPHNASGCYLYNDYVQARGKIGLKMNDILPINGTSAGINGCKTFGVNKLMSVYKQIYDEGNGIFLANTGHLHKPVSQDNWMTETRTDLFSHHTMKREAQYVDAFREGSGPGVLGRMCDILERYGHAVAATSVNKKASMIDGDPSTGRFADTMSTEGLPRVFERQFLNGRKGQELRLFLESLNSETTDNSGVMADMWSQRFIDIWDKTDKLVNTMQGLTLKTPFTTKVDIDAINSQLKLVSQLIAARDKRGNGINRDVFYVEMGGFDTHSDMANILDDRLPSLNRAIANFWSEMKAQGLASNIVFVQGSEFGRTISGNSNEGTDHAWAGNYFIFGGDVKGGKILGKYPQSFGESFPTNIGRGRLIPTHSWDALWYGITQWFGINTQTDINYVLPNNQNFGCDLFTDGDLFVSGINQLIGCGGPSLTSKTSLDVTEPRYLTGEEQKVLCKIAIASAAKSLSLTEDDARCFVETQQITPTADGAYSIGASAKINFDGTVPPAVASQKMVDAITKTSARTASSRVVKNSVPRTDAPSASPSMEPSISLAPTTETLSPSKPPSISTGLQFIDLDIGSTGLKGKSIASGNSSYYILGAGNDIYGDVDSFHYMFMETSGDASFTILIEKFDAASPWSKGGIMFRSSLDRNSINYALLTTRSFGVVQQIRRCVGCDTEQYPKETVKISSVWVRVTKNGNTLTSYYKDLSSSFWIPYGVRLSMSGINSARYYLGIAVSSRDKKAVATLQISNLYLSRSCSTINSQQCKQSSNCGIGPATSTCYNLGPIQTRWVKVQLPTINSLHLAEIEVFNEDGYNVAKNKMASMSSIFNQYFHPYANDGTDGIVKNNFFMTAVEYRPYWMVDLGLSQLVQKVVLYNRDYDCDNDCKGKLSGAVISLLDNSGVVFDSRELGNTEDMTISNISFTPVLLGTSQTRKVKVQLTQNNYLHLSEVQVFDETGTNRALNKSASMSSTLLETQASSGTNGIIGDDYFQTNIQDGAWWEVDLGDGLVNVKNVVIHNRMCDVQCQGRLSNAVVSLIDNSGNIFDSKSLGNTTGIARLNITFTANVMSAIPKWEYKEVGSFNLFGNGWCRDYGGSIYDFIRYQIAGVTFESCMSKCLDNNDGLVGLSVYSTSYCYCWYENNYLSQLPPGSYGYVATNNTGTGEISQVSKQSDTLCYKYNYKIDTKGPTKKPTSLPTTSPPTTKPTVKPSGLPTAQPPSPLEWPNSYDYVGAGFCADALGRQYDYIVHFQTSAISAESCASLCIKSADFYGLSTIAHINIKACVCWYENDMVPYSPDSSFVLNAGSGPIHGVVLCSGCTCYRVENSDFEFNNIAL